VEYFVSYYDTTSGGLRPVIGHLHRERRLGERPHRADAAVRDQGAAGATGLDHRRNRLLDLRPRRSAGLPQHGVLHLVRGDRLDQRKLLRRLADMQYTRNELDLAQGSYRVRATSSTSSPAESEREAVRVELFDDEIEALSWFDP